MPKRALARLVPIHPIQVVAHRTGLSADVIRAWEKRYTVVAPARSENGRRLYSGADIERLQLLAQATASGRTIGQLAALPAAAAEGWKVTYLGPGLPAEDIADAAALAGARAVALSLGGAPNGRSVSRELQQFRRLLPRGSALIVEGAAAEVHARVVRDAGALVARDLAALRAHLGTLRGADEDSTGRPAEQQG
jgi:DNA-binding transcriptional MerR regulator